MDVSKDLLHSHSVPVFLFELRSQGFKCILLRLLLLVLGFGCFLLVEMVYKHFQSVVSRLLVLFELLYVIDEMLEPQLVLHDHIGRRLVNGLIFCIVLI